ncbi:substrate-binding domain-containing protein [Pirellulales bacterium]|nr:substrate-binding domain-containing protein [Pirellulales bacterium]
MSNSTLSPSADRQFTPKYVDLARNLVSRIAKEGLSVGDRLGTEEGLGEQYGLSRVTVRQALELLEKEGYVARKRARGTFVTREVEHKDHFTATADRVLLVCSNEQKSHSDEDSAFCTVLHSIEQALARRQITVQLMGVGQSPKEDRARLEAALSQGDLGGVLAIGPCIENYSDLLSETEVVITCSFQPSLFPWVGDDISTASRVSIAHLLSKGHERIAMLCGSWIDGDAFAGFVKGMTEAMNQVGVAPQRSLMVLSYPGESLEDLAVEILSQSPAPSAVFCENWRVCEAVSRASARLGLSIPEDISVVGYGLNVQRMRRPVHFTAYVPNTSKVGESAAELLADLLSGAQEPTAPVIIEGALVEGDSVLQLE